MKNIKNTAMFKFIQALLTTAVLACFSVSALASSNQVTVTVKKIEGYGESSDAFTFNLKQFLANAIWSITQGEPVRSKAKRLFSSL